MLTSNMDKEWQTDFMSRANTGHSVVSESQKAHWAPFCILEKGAPLCRQTNEIKVPPPKAAKNQVRTPDSPCALVKETTCTIYAKAELRKTLRPCLGLLIKSDD